MSPLTNRYLVAGEVKAEQTWQLIEWCRTHGADEFALEVMALENSPAFGAREAEAELAPFRLADAPRERITVLVGRPRVQPTPRYALSLESIAVLRRLFNDGLFDYPTAEWDAGWLEDPTFYRDGEVMLGIVSHESEGLLRLTELENAQVAALGIRLRDLPEWI